MSDDDQVNGCANNMMFPWPQPETVKAEKIIMVGDCTDISFAMAAAMHMLGGTILVSNEEPKIDASMLAAAESWKKPDEELLKHPQPWSRRAGWAWKGKKRR